MTASPNHPLHARTLRVLIFAQLQAGLGIAAGVTVGALLMHDISGSISLAGIPATLFAVGAAIAAFSIGKISDRFGRRPGLAGGYLLGGIGSLGLIAAAAWESLPLAVVSFFLYGSGSATNLQARYAGSDLAAPSHQARSMSYVLMGTTVGVIAGPLLVTATGGIAASFGLSAYAGPFMLSALAYCAAAGFLMIFLRPDPLLVARKHSPDTPVTSAGSTRWSAGAIMGTAIMLVSQLVMVAVMTMTPVHVQAMGHSIGVVGIIISVHVAFMFLPSPISGWLTDSWGAPQVATLAGVTMVTSAVIAAIADGSSPWPYAISLGLLGLGWSFGMVSGTNLVTSSTPLHCRASRQGTADVFVALCSALGGVGSSVIAGAAGFGMLAWVCGGIALMIGPLGIATRFTSQTK